MAELYRRNPKIEESPLQGELMLFDPVKSQFFVLNPTMAHVWKNCDGEMSLEKIVGAVPAQFSDSEAHPVAAEMKTALDELVALGLVTAS
jgi:coenzyme PQQ synthesis protein D (PqqD)